jgi:hypothetical protein
MADERLHSAEFGRTGPGCHRGPTANRRLVRHLHPHNSQPTYGQIEAITEPDARGCRLLTYTTHTAAGPRLNHMWLHPAIALWTVVRPLSLPDPEPEPQDAELEFCWSQTVREDYCCNYTAAQLRAALGLHPDQPLPESLIRDDLQELLTGTNDGPDRVEIIRFGIESVMPLRPASDR